MTHSIFYDPHGLPNSEGPEDDRQGQRARPRHARHGADEVPADARVREDADRCRSRTARSPPGLTNPNHLINPKKRDYYADATGIKTGFSGPAGYCVTASAKRGDMELIAVVMGARGLGAAQLVRHRLAPVDEASRNTS